MSEFEPTYQHPNRHPHLRQAVHFLTAQILTEPHLSDSDHYHPVEVVLDPILDVQANGEYLDIALRAPHVAWDENSYYQHTGERVSFYVPHDVV